MRELYTLTDNVLKVYWQRQVEARNLRDGLLLNTKTAPLAGAVLYFSASFLIGFDLDLPGPSGFRLRQSQRQDAIGNIRFDMIRIDRDRHTEGADEGAVGQFTNKIIALIHIICRIASLILTLDAND